jgi:hypothetical protein
MGLRNHSVGVRIERGSKLLPLIFMVFKKVVSQSQQMADQNTSVIEV